MPKTLLLAVALLTPAIWMLNSAGRAGTAPRQTEIRGRSQASNQNGRLQMNDHKSIQAIEQSRTIPPGSTHAQAKITVHSSEAKPYDQTVNPALLEINLIERFAGDIEGESTVRALQVQGNPQSASLVSMQRFRGRLGAREGTFVLQGSESVEDGKIHATWFVVPGSGTDGLSGLRGKGGFKGDFGKGSEGTLDYWFE
jgi:hypothetical protein